MQTILTRVPPSGPPLQFDIPQSPLDFGLPQFVVNPGNANAYQTIQEAVTAATPYAQSSSGRGAEIILAPNLAFAGPVAVPTGIWKIGGMGFPHQFETWNEGAIVWTATADSQLTLANFYQAVGDITATLASGTATLILENMAIDTNVALSGGDNFKLIGRALQPPTLPFSAGQAYVGAITSAGEIAMQNYELFAGLTTTYHVLDFHNCLFSGAPNTITAGGVNPATMRMSGTRFINPTTIAFAGGAGELLLDEWTLQSYLELGCGVPTNGRVVPALSPQLVGTGDVGASLWLGFDVAAGAGGAPDDVTIFAASVLPFQCNVQDAFFKVSAAVGGSTAQLRSAAGGGGTLFAQMSGAATALARNTVNDENTLTPGAALFLRRSDSAIAGRLYVQLRPF